jgi:hypothetical protein
LLWQGRLVAGLQADQNAGTSDINHKADAAASPGSLTGSFSASNVIPRPLSSTKHGR